MRYGFVAITILAVTTCAAPASAGAQRRAEAAPIERTPSFDDCFRLAWVRGVHVEREELAAFNEDCMANRVPFQTGNPADSVVPHYN